jgi:D-glycero-D-manno-heptose 1,7-bisphosphate phosphatase
MAIWALYYNEKESITMRNRALFLDRDGTLVHPSHYPSRPADLRLYEGVGPDLRRLQDAGFRLVLITNQSGLARGYFGAAELDAMHDYLASQLAGWGVRLDGIYYCPHHPEGTIPDLAVACECRKPRPGMLLRAAAELEIDMRRCWFIGDILDDVEAGNSAGCRTILVDLDTERPPTAPRRRPDFAARDTRHALAIVAAHEHRERLADLDYLPVGWSRGDLKLETRNSRIGLRASSCYKELEA